MTISLFNVNCLTSNFVGMLHELVSMFVLKDFVQGRIAVPRPQLRCGDTSAARAGAYFNSVILSDRILITGMVYTENLSA